MIAKKSQRSNCPTFSDILANVDLPIDGTTSLCVVPFVGDHVIGRGSFASVWLGHHITSQLKVGTKVIPKNSIDTELSRTRLVREISIMRQVRHHFIASLACVSEDAGNFYLVMEYVGNKNLRDCVNDGRRFTEDKARHYFCQLLWAFEDLHTELHSIHRDFIIRKHYVRFLQ
jgi:serine/threonine protein kinase